MTDPAAATPHERAAAAIRVGDVFTRARIMFFGRWASYCALMAIGYAPLGMGEALVAFAATHPAPPRAPQDTGDAIAIGVIVGLGFLAAFVGLLLAPAAIAYGVAQEITGRGLSFGQCIGAALRRSLAVLAVSAVVVILGGLGALLLIVPGLIVFSIYSVAIPACMAERIGPLKAMSRSAFLTKGNRWRVFGLLALLYILGVVIDLMVSRAATAAVGALPALIVVLPVKIGVAAFSAVVAAVLYAQLRAAREGVDVERIVKVFD